jgi:hypothetical protein
VKISELQNEVRRLEVWSRIGCGNHGCVIHAPVGMGTNSTCVCTPTAFQIQLQWLANEVNKTGNRYARFDAETPATGQEEKKS